MSALRQRTSDVDKVKYLILERLNAAPVNRALAGGTIRTYGRVMVGRVNAWERPYGQNHKGYGQNGRLYITQPSRFHAIYALCWFLFNFYISIIDSSLILLIYLFLLQNIWSDCELTDFIEVRKSKVSVFIAFLLPFLMFV